MTELRKREIPVGTDITLKGTIVNENTISASGNGYTYVDMAGDDFFKPTRVAVMLQEVFIEGDPA